jgi:dCTP deaminase
VLASTVERVFTAPDIVAQLDGRSTLARLGVLIHCGSMMIDNVHEEFRSITLEFANVGAYDVKLRPGDCVGMLFFSALGCRIEQHASPQYRGQSHVMPPKVLKVS